MKIMSMALILFSITAFAADERTWDKSVEVDSAVHFYLESHKGEVRITAGEEETLTISARIYMKNGREKLDQEQLDQLLEAVEMKFSQRSQSVSLKVDFNRETLDNLFAGLLGKNQENPTVDLDIALPSQASLTLETHKGEIDIDAPGGEVKIQTHKGNANIRNVRADFSLETHKGNIQVEIQQLGSLDIESHKGNVELTIHDAHDFQITGESSKGSLKFSGMDIPVKRKKKGSAVAYSHGNGENRIDLETHKGNITIDFVN